MGGAAAKHGLVDGFIENEQARHDNDGALNGRRQPFDFAKSVIEPLTGRFFRTREMAK